MRTWPCLASIAAGLAFGAQAALELPRLFDSHMVLPRDAEVPVFGKAEPGVEVRVAFAGQSLTAQTGADGRWEVALAPMEACAEGRELSVESGDERRTLSDVLVGDVWLCSGQSNMEYSFGWRPNGWEEFKAEAAKFPMIRTVRVVRGDADFPDSGAVYAPNFLPQKLGWHLAADPFELTTAVGYFFARRLVLETGVPIGLLDVSWSASKIEPFIAPAAFAGVPGLEAYAEAVARCMPNTAEGRREIARYRNELAVWAEKTALSPGKGDAMAHPDHPDLPSLSRLGLGSHYNRMIHPLTRLPIKGVIWYQGCANAAEGERYLALYTALVNGWRAAWRRPDLPFYSVQLAAFWNNWRANKDIAGGEGFVLVREAQRKSLAIPHTGLAVAIDLGDPWEIHPPEKLHVGERLALWALRDTYGRKGIVVSGPLFKTAVPEDGAMRISFDSVGSGLMAGEKTFKDNRDPVPAPPGTPLRGFAVAGEDRVWHWADAQIEGDGVVVSSPNVPSPVAVRYAFHGAPEANLYNREGLPASPFRSDDWPCPQR